MRCKQCTLPVTWKYTLGVCLVACRLERGRRADLDVAEHIGHAAVAALAADFGLAQRAEAAVVKLHPAMRICAHRTRVMPNLRRLAQMVDDWRRQKG